MSWQPFNTALYGAYYRARNRPRRGPAPVEAPAPDRPRVLFLAWGRIGDTVLSTGILKHFRAAFPGCEIVCAARAEARPVVAPYADRTLPFDAVPRGPWAAVVTDVHFFYGGGERLGGLVEALEARRVLVYQGYHAGPGLAPVRRYPRNAEVVPAAPGTRHVLDHSAAYFAEVLRRLDVPFAPQDFRPALAAEPATPSGAVAWQPRSDNRKKDWPLARWREVLAAFPDVRFVALGTGGARAAVDGLGLANVENRCGETTLRDAIGIIAGARAFLGPDSGLTHIAAVLGKPTVCVGQNANLGTFFPYPESYGFDNLHALFHQGYRECAGCFMTCRHEPIALTWLLGAKCLRELPAAGVVEALRARIPDAVPAA